MNLPLLSWLTIAFSSVAVYLFLLLAFRLVGKKELSQLSVVDLVFILLISNSVQNAMVGPDSTLLGGLIAASSLFLVNTVVRVVEKRFPRLRKIIQGHPLMLIYHGQIQAENLRKTGITEDELLETAHEHGVLHIREINLAILELDGSISVLSDNFQKNTRHTISNETASGGRNGEGN